jgi:hypothetical protein
MSWSPVSRRTRAGRYLTPEPELKGNETRTIWPRSKRIIDAVGLGVTGEELVRREPVPVDRLLMSWYDNDHVHGCLRPDLGGEIMGTWRLQSVSSVALNSRVFI